MVLAHPFHFAFSTLSHVHPKRNAAFPPRMDFLCFFHLRGCKKPAATCAELLIFCGILPQSLFKIESYPLY
jgi:hypothetical protein